MGGGGGLCMWVGRQAGMCVNLNVIYVAFCYYFLLLYYCSAIIVFICLPTHLHSCASMDVIISLTLQPRPHMI